MNGADIALLTDLYQLTMLQAYYEEGMNGTAVFDLFVRRLPPHRNYLVAAGLDDVLEYLETLRFSADSLDYLRSLGTFTGGFIDHLRDFRFTGDVYAVREGTVVFANEPIVEIVAPLPEAQLVETFVMNQIHLQTMLASKAARVVTAAQGRSVVDFGLRRIHGIDAGIKAARASYIAGVDATSNVLAGRLYGIPVAGTMAHSYIQAHASEIEAFRAFLKTFPSTTLLVDTYDTLQGVRHIVDLKRELGDDFRVRAIRLDSGNLEELARESRRILDGSGLQGVGIIVSNSLDEYSVDALVRSGAPVDGFGVGVRMGVSSDAPSLDTAYKLVEYAGVPRMKLSAEKSNLPGRKQIFRKDDHDVIALSDETPGGEPLLFKAMENGQRVEPRGNKVELARSFFRGQLGKLPASLKELSLANPPYPLKISAGLLALRDRAIGNLRA